MRATIPRDVSGSPALTVPLGASSDGLPIGVQLVGRHVDDRLVLRGGAAFEGLRGEGPSHPPVGSGVQGRGWSSAGRPEAARLGAGWWESGEAGGVAGGSSAKRCGVYGACGSIAPRTARYVKLRAVKAHETRAPMIYECRLLGTFQ